MNNKELAIGVFKHPLIQEILKQKLAESSVVNRLIVQEVLKEYNQEDVDFLLSSPGDNVDAWLSRTDTEGKQALLDLIKQKLAEEAEGEIDKNSVKKLQGVAQKITKSIQLATGANTGSDLQGIAKIISEVAKESIAERTGPWVTKAIRKIPIIGQGADYVDSAMEFAGVGSLGENVVKGLLKPIDWMVGGLWEAIGAEKLESIVREIVGGEERYQALLAATANGGTDGAKAFLKQDALGISQRVLTAAANAFPDQFQSVRNFKVGGYEVGNFFLSYLLDEKEMQMLDAIPDPETVTGGDGEDTGTDADGEGAGTDGDDEFIQSLDEKYKSAFRSLVKVMNKDTLEESDVPKDTVFDSYENDIKKKILDATKSLSEEAQALIQDALANDEIATRFRDFYFSETPETSDTPEPTTDRPAAPEGEDTLVKVLQSTEETKGAWENYEKARDDFQQRFLIVPFLFQQQIIMVNLLKSLTALNKYTSSYTRGPAAVVESEGGSNFRSLRRNMRAIEMKAGALERALGIFLAGVATTKNSDQAKQAIVQNVKALQKYLAITYDSVNKLNKITEAEEDGLESREDIINKVEDIHDYANQRLGQLDTIMSTSLDASKSSGVIDEIKERFNTITQYFPDTARFTPTAEGGTKEALITFTKFLKTFRSQTLVPLYSALGDENVTDSDIFDIKTAIKELATKMKQLLGVDSEIADEVEPVSETDPSFADDPNPELDDWDPTDEETSDFYDDLLAELEPYIEEVLDDRPEILETGATDEDVLEVMIEEEPEIGEIIANADLDEDDEDTLMNKIMDFIDDGFERLTTSDNSEKTDDEEPELHFKDIKEFATGLRHSSREDNIDHLAAFINAKAKEATDSWDGVWSIQMTDTDPRNRGYPDGIESAKVTPTEKGKVLNLSGSEGFGDHKFNLRDEKQAEYLYNHLRYNGKKLPGRFRNRWLEESLEEKLKPIIERMLEDN